MKHLAKTKYFPPKINLISKISCRDCTVYLHVIFNFFLPPYIKKKKHKKSFL